MILDTGDLKFFYTGMQPADVALAENNQDLLRDPGLETAVLISLFSDQRAAEEDKLPDREDTRRGWWGDSLTDSNIGSKLWLLSRAKISDGTKANLEQYSREALQWLIDDGVADSVIATSTRNGLYRIDTTVEIKKLDNSNVFFNYFLNWKYQIIGGFTK